MQKKKKSYAKHLPCFQPRYFFARVPFVFPSPLFILAFIGRPIKYSRDPRYCGGSVMHI